MKAKIVSITKNLNDWQNPQIDLVVELTDKDLPADHQYPQGGKRQLLCTMPYEKYDGMTEGDLREYIRAEAKNVDDMLKKAKRTKDKEGELKSFEGIEITV